MDTASASATLNTSAVGSFHIRAYVDCNGSGTFQGDDPGTGQRIDREPYVVLNYVVVRVQGFVAGPDTDSNSRFNEVGAGYFATMGVPLMAGREFTEADGPDSPKVAVVNEEFA